MHEHKNGNETASKTEKVLQLLEDICVKKGVKVKSIATDLYEEMKRAEEAAFGKIKTIAYMANNSTRKNPWPYIGSSAAFGVLLGLLLPSRR